MVGNIISEPFGYNEISAQRKQVTQVVDKGRFSVENARFNPKRTDVKSFSFAQNYIKRIIGICILGWSENVDSVHLIFCVNVL